MFHFGSRQGSPAYGVILDIGSGSIGAAIVESNPEQTLPTLIYRNQTSLRISAEAHDIRRVREALLATALTLSQEGLAALRNHNPRAKITRILVTCGSPWSYTIARNVSYENDEPFKVTKNLIHDLAETAEEEICTHIQESAPFSGDFTVVERATTDVAINDYVVNEPVGKTGTICSLSHMIGLVPKELLEALREVKDKLFPEAELAVHTYLLATYCVLRDLYPHTHAFTIIDVSGEATEFGVVENNLLSENKSLSQGSSTFIRGVMDETGSPASDIETLIATEGKNHITERAELEKQVKSYVASVMESVQALTEHRALPRDTIITAHHPYEQLFKDMIRLALLEANKVEPNILAVEQNLLHEVLPHGTYSTHIALSARFFHKLHSCGELENE